MQKDFNDFPPYLKSEAEDLQAMQSLAKSFGVSLTTYLLYRILVKLNDDCYIKDWRFLL